MCGIIGYVGNRTVAPILIKGLKRLEYRGYDSAGITVKNSVLKTLKVKGGITKLKKLFLKNNLSGTIGIGHTRWATHGEVSESNAHPHNSKNDELSLVHNGIIENYVELKKMLVSQGVIFNSQTDSEVLVHLIQKYYDKDLESAVLKALSLVKGTYGLAVLSSKEDRIIAARNGSPLVLGVGKKEFFIASDISAILDYTKKVVHLKDKDVVSITKNNYQIKNLGKIKNRRVETVNLKLESLEKKNYDYFMLKEIFEQPETLINVTRGRIDKSNVYLGGLNLSEKFIKNIKRIILIACGTSWHSCLVGEYLFENYLKIPVEVEYASEFRYRQPIINKNDLVIVISQSGETADTLAALREAKKLGAKTLGIVNVVGSTISQEVDGGIYLHAGLEIGVASTKAFTSQVMALHLLNIYFGKRIKSISLLQTKKLINEINMLPQKIKQTLKLDSLIKTIAKKYFSSKNFLYLGRGINFPVALEGALKLKEISYIHAEGYPAAEMKHGPIALIDKNLPVVFIANKVNGTYDKILSNMEEVKSRNGKIIVIATENDKKIVSLADEVIFVPKTIESLTPVINAIPLQLLAYHIAVLKGCNVDKPRNLAKSVTVE